MILAVLILFQIMNLLKYVDKSNQLLSRAFESILYEDFSERLDTHLLDSSLKEVCESLNRIITKFQQNRLEKEQQFQYLQTVIQQTGMGLISVKADGEVNLINKSARQMLQLPNLRHIQQLQSVDNALSCLLMQMRSGDKRYIDIENQNNSMQVAVYAKEISLQGEHYNLFTLQNIQSELEEKEMEAWKNLIRVLSHEIMNSVTPISSLAATANMLIGRGKEIDPSDIDDLRQAMQAIEKRGQGLIQFVQNYRRFARIPDPVKQIVLVAKLFKRIENLIQPNLKAGTIRFSTSIKPESLQLRVDPDLIEQVLLNLLSNAIEAVKESQRPEIELKAEMNSRSVMVIQIRDNGRGIAEDVLPKIFIPFFTTRPEGSGIGLSLSRQIMRLHGGNIRVKSEPGTSTVFSLSF
jgi:nitrogen fixation/metabolism regulation signal transduction histidine kinase